MNVILVWQGGGRVMGAFSGG